MPVVPRISRSTIRREEPRTDSIPGPLTGWRSRLNWHALSGAFVIGFLLSSIVVAAGAAARLASLQQLYQKYQSQFASELEAVAVTCNQSKLDALATEIRQLKSPSETLGDIEKIPTHTQPPLLANLPAPENAARVRVHKLQTDFAVSLYGLARKAIKEQHPSLAFRLVHEVLRHNPDHAQARGLLGFQRVKEEWTTPFAIAMNRQKKVWHQDYGWISSENIARYNNGERFCHGKWMTAEREETIRSDFKDAWEVDTEHFHVRTNYSLQKGVHLAAAVEIFHRYFMREFASFFKTPQQLDKLFASGTAAKDGDLYEIYHFRLQQEFVDWLKKEGPLVSQINGLYLPSDRRAYFFHNPKITDEESLQTLYHEVTHQLLSESTVHTVPVGHSRDFWVVEGIACYFESFHVSEDGTVSVGNINHPRIAAARNQVVVTQDQEPLARFTASGMLIFQKGNTPTLQKRYAQATGLAHFFMHYQDGVYRDEFIEYLTRVYTPDQRIRGTKTLEDIIGVPFATLDTQYAAYFKEMPAPVTAP